MRKLITLSVALGMLSALALDAVTVSRLQAKVNERQLIGRETVVIGGVTNLVTRYRQSGVEWSVTNVMKSFTGVLAVRRYSRLKVYVACVQLGLWDRLEAWLKTQTVNGVNAYTAFMLANELAEDNELFIPMIESVKTALGIDDATVKAILDSSAL